MHRRSSVFFKEMSDGNDRSSIFGFMAWTNRGNRYDEKEAPAVPKVFLKILLILSNLSPIFISDVICLDLTSVLNKITKKLYNARLRICI